MATKGEEGGEKWLISIFGIGLNVIFCQNSKKYCERAVYGRAGIPRHEIPISGLVDFLEFFLFAFEF